MPEVSTIEVDENIHEWPTKLENLKFFANLKNSKEDKNKTIQYKKRFAFISEKKISSNENDYLKSIKIKPKLIEINSSNILRASQLTIKTNQFNLRTKRYNLHDIKKFNNNKKNYIFLVSLKDIYGDHGNVGFVILRNINNKFYFLDTFILSCRILGRYLETWIMKRIFDKLEKEKLKFLIAEFIPTKKNIVSKNFLQDHGFKKVDKKKLRKLADGYLNKDIDSQNLSTIYYCDKNNLKLKNIKIYEKN